MAPDLDGPDEPGAPIQELDDTVLDEELELPAEVRGFTRFRVLAFAALGPLLIGYAAIAALLAVVTAIATHAHFATTGVLEAALPGWLAAHQVPLRILGLELGVLPLLPTLGVAALTAKAASGAAHRLGLYKPGQAGPVIAIITLAHGVAGMVIALVTDHGEVTTDPLSALYYPALVAALAATAGTARPCGMFDAIGDRADAVAVAGLRTGAMAVALLLAAGGALLTFGLLTSVETARDLFPMGIGNAVGMLLLSIGYLPNAMIGATSFTAGTGFSLGSVAVSPVEFDGGPVPGLPLLAALPEREAVWWPVLFLLPLAVGILVGRRLRFVDESPVARLRAVAVAAGVVAVSFVVMGGAAGGHLGRGPFDPVSMRAAALSIALVLWTAIPAAVATWFGGPRPAAQHLPGLIDDEPEAPAEPEELDDPEPVAEDVEEPDEDLAKDLDDEEEPAQEVPEPRDAVEESGEVARD